MKKVALILVAVTAVVLVACTRGKSSAEAGDADKTEEGIRPTGTKVQGPLKEFFEVVDKPYKTSKDGFAKINVEFKRLAGKFQLGNGEQLVTNKRSAENGDGGLAIGLTIEFLDKDGNVIDTAESDGQQLARLAGFDEGDTGTVSFYLPMSRKTPAAFRISSEMTHVKPLGTTGKRGANQDLEDIKEAAEAIGALGGAMGGMMDAAEKAADMADELNRN